MRAEALAKGDFWSALSADLQRANWTDNLAEKVLGNPQINHRDGVLNTTHRAGWGAPVGYC